MISPEAGSPLSSAEVSALACSIVMCGGSGGHLGIGHRLVDHRSVGGERLIPGGSDLLGAVDADPDEAQHLRVAGIREVREVLGPLELRIALHRALLPGHLVEVAVVEREHDQPLV